MDQHDTEPLSFFRDDKQTPSWIPSETKVKRGVRIVHGHKELAEKLGRNDLCPCGSGKRFRRCCLKSGCF
jgi:uncharacterized protein YecA (UPF0149 family)